jgi:hypothetical protein
MKNFLNSLIIIFSMVYIIINQETIKETSIENSEKNNQELIIACIIIPITFLALFLDIKQYNNSIKFFFGLSVISTSIAWDFSARNNLPIGRDIFSTLGVLSIILFFWFIF